MKRNLLKRSLALAVAVAMTVSSVPTNLAFAEEAIVDEPLVIEETLDDAGAAEVAAVEEEQPEEAAADLETITLEDAEVIDTADVPADIALGEDAIAPISLKDPFKVSNLRIEEDEYGTSYIKWHADENYETYEFTIKDQLGNTYLAPKYDYSNDSVSVSYVNWTWNPNYNGEYWDDVDDNGDIYLSVEYLIGSVAVWKKDSDGNWSVATNPSDPKKELRGLQNGFTYSISVCAVGTEGDKDAVVGPVPYTYTEEVETVTKPQAPTNFRYDAENEVLKWDAPTTGRVDSYRLVISDDLYRYGWIEDRSVKTKDPATGEDKYSVVYDFADAGVDAGYQLSSGASLRGIINSNYGFYNGRVCAYPKDKIGTGVGYTEENQPQPVKTEDGDDIDLSFAPGKTYTVQIYAENSGEDANGNPVTEKSALSAEVKVTVPAVKPVEEAKLGKVGNLKVDEDGEYLSWDPIELEDEDWELWYDLAYVITVKKDNVVVGTPYTTDSRNFYIESYTDIPGTYTFEVYAILQDEDDEEETITVARGETASVSYTVSATRNAGKAKPGKVTGLVLETNNDDAYAYGGIYSNPRIAWNELNDPNMDVDRYDIELTDAAGHVYYLSYDVEVNQTTNVRTPKPKYYSVEGTSVTVSSFGNCFTYTLPDGTSATRVTGQDGKFLTGFDAGQTYTVRVCAVDEYQTYDAAKKEWTEQENAGEWSEAKTYQIGTVSAITDLKYVPDSTGEKGNFYYFSYTGMPGTVWYQISTDPTFNEDNPNTTRFTRANDGTYKLQLGKSLFSLPNTTYYVRAVNVFGGSSKAPTQKEADELMKQNPGMMTSFTTDPAVTTAKTITGFKLKKEYDGYFEFVFDPILEEGDSYKLQYSKDKTNWKDYSDGGLYLDKNDLEDGVTYYVRAVAYIEVDDKEVEGTPSAEVSVVVNKAAGAVAGFTMKKTPEGYVFSYTNEFHNGEYVTLQVADSMEFPENSQSMIYNDPFQEEEFYHDKYNGDYFDWEYTDEYTIPYDKLTPGKTYYARARVVSNGAKKDEKYGPWSNIITITPKVADISISTRGVSSTELYLSMSEVSDGDYLDAYLSGYQVQKKKGKKWTTLTYTTDNEYKESGLKANTKYQYRVRPYYYNTETKKYIYGSYVYCEALTWGNALNLKAKAKSKTSVKLTWTKVTGAKGYEIYRKVTSSAGTTIKSDSFQDAFESYRLVKTIKKASTKSYTDKKLTSGMSYSYIVRAYRTINKKKYYISDTATVNLSIKNFKLVDVTYQTSGKTKITWSPIYTAKGYLIEKQDNETGNWSTYADIKKAKTSSYTLPANSTESVMYRIRAYDKNDVYSNEVTAWTYPYLKAPTNVKAAVQSDGSVKVTWSQVAGADYYLVYRTTSSMKMYDKDLKAYTYYYAGKALKNYVADASTLSGYRATASDKLTGTELYDRKIAYTTASGVTNTIWAGPLDGVEYYYYVQPIKKAQAHIWKDNGYEVEDCVYGNMSKAVSATVNGTSIAKPTKVKAKASKGKVKVSWKKVSGAKGYVVYRSTKKKSGFVPVGYISKGSTKSYTDKTAKKGKNYYYKVCAYKLSAAGSYQYSAYSSVKKVKAK